jgi:hypothetical protein
MKEKPTKPDGYCDELSGNWDDVPEWAIKRLNFLEEVLSFERKMRAPLMDEPCKNHLDISCLTVKNCYPYFCDGSCGHNEIWVSDTEKKKIQDMKECGVL